MELCFLISVGTLRCVETMIEYGKYHILEGILPHTVLHIGLLADGNIYIT